MSKNTIRNQCLVIGALLACIAYWSAGSANGEDMRGILAGMVSLSSFFGAIAIIISAAFTHFDNL